MMSEKCYMDKNILAFKSDSTTATVHNFMSAQP